MANPDSYETSHVEGEKAQEERVATESYRDEIKKFEREVPSTPEERKSFINTMEVYIKEVKNVVRPVKAFTDGLVNAVNEANEKGNLRWTSVEKEQGKKILEKIVGKLTVNPKEARNIVEKDENTGEYYINENGLFDFINTLDKEDRKFIKKIIKAVIKTKKQKELKEVASKQEKKKVKRQSDMRKKMYENRIS